MTYGKSVQIMPAEGVPPSEVYLGAPDDEAFEGGSFQFFEVTTDIRIANLNFVAPRAAGGGVSVDSIHVQEKGRLWLESCTVRLGGGGIVVDKGASAHISNCSLVGSQGSAVAIHPQSGYIGLCNNVISGCGAGSGEEVRFDPNNKHSRPWIFEGETGAVEIRQECFEGPATSLVVSTQVCLVDNVIEGNLGFGVSFRTDPLQEMPLPDGKPRWGRKAAFKKCPPLDHGPFVSAFTLRGNSIRGNGTGFQHMADRPCDGEHVIHNERMQGQGGRTSDYTSSEDEPEQDSDSDF